MNEYIYPSDMTKACGLALRDYFAAEVMSGLLANSSRDTDVIGFARDAYLFADAMLAYRDEQAPDTPKPKSPKETRGTDYES